MKTRVSKLSSFRGERGPNKKTNSLDPFHRIISRGKNDQNLRLVQNVAPL